MKSNIMLDDDELLNITEGLNPDLRRAVLRTIFWDFGDRRKTHPRSLSEMTWDGAPGYEPYPTRTELIDALINTNLYTQEEAEIRISEEHYPKQPKEQKVRLGARSHYAPRKEINHGGV